MATPTGLSRREIWIDARDLQSDSDPDNPLTPAEYQAVLENRGKGKLAEKQLVRSFASKVRTYDSTYQIGEDYQTGDIITVIDERLGLTVDAVVQAVERSVGKDEDLVLTFGYGQPTVFDKLARKADK